MTFWQSTLGELSGKAEDAFTKIFKQQIPNDTYAPAEIERFFLEVYLGYKSYQIHWHIIDGEFKNRMVFHRIKAFDEDEKKRHSALNMMMYLYNMFNLKPKHSNEPHDDDLLAFTHKKAGLRIQLTDPNENGKQYNYVSEVHPIQGFVAKSGVAVESAFSRNEQRSHETEEEIPF